jgi:hypothetical protein
MQLYTDERCVISDGRVLAFPRNVNVRSGALELLATESVPHDLGITDRVSKKVGRDWNNVGFLELLGAATVPRPLPLGAVFFIRGWTQAATLEPMSKSAAILEFASSGMGMLVEMGVPDRIAVVASLLKDVHCYELYLGAPDETALLIRDTVRNAKPPNALGFSA